MTASLETSAAAGAIFALEPARRPGLQAALAAQGFVGLEAPAVRPGLFDDLVREAAAQRPGGWGRASGGNVEHRVWRAEIGAAARAFLAAPETLALLGELVGEPVIPSFAATCFTYYEGPEDFLGLHTDRDGACTYTLILYLEAAWPAGEPPGEGLELHVHARDAEAGSAPVVRLATRPNTAAVGLGSAFPHRRPPLRAGERVVALTACYAPARLAADVPAAGAPAAEAPAAETPAASGPVDAAAAEILIDEGFHAWRAGRIDEATARFAQALERDAASDKGWSGAGFALWSAGRFDEALAAFGNAVRCDGGVAAHWSNVGLCLRELKAFDRAVAAFGVALMLDPGYAPAVNEWANVLQDLGRSDEAVPLYHRALALDPARAVVHHNLGVAYTRIGEPMLAVHALHAALDRDPGYAHALEELAMLYARAGLVEQAHGLLARSGTERAARIAASLGAGPLGAGSIGAGSIGAAPAAGSAAAPPSP